MVPAEIIQMSYVKAAAINIPPLLFIMLFIRSNISYNLDLENSFPLWILKQLQRIRELSAKVRMCDEWSAHYMSAN